MTDKVKVLNSVQLKFYIENLEAVAVDQWKDTLGVTRVHVACAGLMVAGLRGFMPFAFGICRYSVIFGETYSKVYYAHN